MPETLHTATSFAGAEAEFDAAWRDPRHTQFELPAHDVNKVLAERYSLKPPMHFTRTMLWDMEMKKAWDPATFRSPAINLDRAAVVEHVARHPGPPARRQLGANGCPPL